MITQSCFNTSSRFSSRSQYLRCVACSIGLLVTRGGADTVRRRQIAWEAASEWKRLLALAASVGKVVEEAVGYEAAVEDVVG